MIEASNLFLLLLKFKVKVMRTPCLLILFLTGNNDDDGGE